MEEEQLPNQHHPRTVIILYFPLLMVIFSIQRILVVCTIHTPRIHIHNPAVIMSVKKEGTKKHVARDSYYGSYVCNSLAQTNDVCRNLQPLLFLVLFLRHFFFFIIIVFASFRCFLFFVVTSLCSIDVGSFCFR